jgi:hypothetical protein
MSALRMDFDFFAKKVDAFLYRRIYHKLTPSDLELAEKWSLELIRKNHPKWSEPEVRTYYDSMLKVRAYAVDEWGRRLR